MIVLVLYECVPTGKDAIIMFNESQGILRGRRSLSTAPAAKGESRLDSSLISWDHELDHVMSEH